MTIDMQQMKEVLEEGREHWEGRRATVRQLVRTLNIPQGKIAQGLGITRQSFHGRLTGNTSFHPGELEAIAVALNVEREVLDMSPMDAVGWVAAHQDRFGEFHWSPLSPQRMAS